MRSLMRATVIPLALGLLLGCGAGAEEPPAARPTGSSSSVSPSATAPAVDRNADLRQVVLAAATAAGEPPTEAGISEVVNDQTSATFLWETPKRRLCLAEAAASGAFNSRRCGDPSTVDWKPGAHVTPVLGPGTTREAWMVVLLAERGARITSVTSRGKDVTSTFVRNLASGSGGRGVYYVQLAELAAGDLEVSLQVDGLRKVERLTFS